MVRGVPAIYLVFGNFDEVAHRRGPFSEQATRRAAPRGRATWRSSTRSAERSSSRTTSSSSPTTGTWTARPSSSASGRAPGDATCWRAPRRRCPRTSSARCWTGARAAARTPLRARADEPVVVEAGNFAHVYLTRGHERRWRRGAAGAPPGGAGAGRGAARTSASWRCGAGRLGGGADRRAASTARTRWTGAPLPEEFSRRAVADFLRELPHMPTAGDLVLYGEAVRDGARWASPGSSARTAG